MGGATTSALSLCHHVETATCLQHLTWEEQETRSNEGGRCRRPVLMSIPAILPKTA